MELKNQSIFILGIARYDGCYQYPSYTLARHLSKDNQVFYIDSPFTIRDKIRFGRDESGKNRKFYLPQLAKRSKLIKIGDLNIIIPPVLLSINFLPEGRVYRMLLRLNEWILASCIKNVLESAGIKQFVYINSFNIHYPHIGKMLKPALSVYHCIDPVIMKYDKRHGIISEEEIILSSDLIICTSRQLSIEKKRLNKNTFFIPNAVDSSLISRDTADTVSPNQPATESRKPVIGYFGNIERRIDYDLVQQITRDHRNKSFVFAGPIDIEFVPRWFYNTPNIHLPGPYTYDRMPEIVEGFDVAIIPFKQDEVSGTIFPLKLFEYLGAGKPVVSTRFNPDLESFTKEEVTYCDDAESFSLAINNALKENDQSRKMARLSVASENTWERRVSEMSELIARYLYARNTHIC